MARRLLAGERGDDAERRTEFGRQVRDTLAHLHDLPHLQTHPLARLLSPETPGRGSTSGRSLQQSLLVALQALSLPADAIPVGESRAYQTLHLRYVEALSVSEVCERLGISRTEYQREHSRGLEALVSLLREGLATFQPTSAAPDRGPPATITVPSALAASAHPSKLPLALTSFVGRERETAEIARLLTSSRLVTLTGPPGVGKTRLALEVAIGLADAFPDGIFIVPLAALSEPDLVAPAIAHALGVQQVGGHHLLERLKDRLRDRRVLLVLDNFEQVIGAASVIAQLLAAASGPRALATSRVALHVRGEQRFPLYPLAVPESARPPSNGEEPPPEPNGYAAVRLFVERAQAVKPDFTLTGDTAPIVVEICRHLDGLPLAIELAAARIGLLPPPALLARLGSRLDLLRGGAHDLPVRQQTLEQTIAWSYDLLNDGEQTLFRQLGEFAGGFTLEAAEAISRAVGSQEIDVLEGLDSLVSQSLLQQEAVDGEPRFTMLQTVQEYARRQLAAHRERETVREAYASYYLTLIGGGTAPQVGSLRPALTGGQLEQEQENARAALAWFLERGEVERGLELLGLLWNFWHDLGIEGEARAWSDRFLARPEAAKSQVRKAVCWAAGMVAWTREDAEAAQIHFAEGLALARAGGDRPGTADFLVLLGNVTRELGDDDAAETLYRESLSLARDRGDAVRGLLIYLGDSARLRGDAAAAWSLYEESLIYPTERSWALRNMAYLALHAGDLATAKSLIHESLSLCRAEGSTLGRTQCLVALAGIASARGQVEQAARLLGSLAAGLERIDAPLLRPDRFERDRCLQEVRGSLNDLAFTRALAAGRAMSLEQAIAYALQEEEPEQRT